MQREFNSTEPADSFQKRRASDLTNIIGGVLLIIGVTFLLAIIKQPEYTTRYVIIIVLTAVACTTLIIVARRGYLSWSAIFFVSFLLAMIFAFSWTGGGIKGHGMKILPVVVLFAGLTLGRKHIFTFGLISILCCLGLALAGHFSLIKVTSPLGDSALIHWIYITTSILLMCLLEYFSIGGLDQAQDKLKEELELRNKSEEKYRVIFESFQDVYYQTDMEGRIVILSPSIKQRTGFEPSELLGKNVLTLYAHPENRKDLLQQLEESGSVQSYELDTLSKKGEVIHNLVSCHKIYDENGQPKGIEGTLHDITQRKKTEDQLRMQNEKLIEIAFLQSHVVRKPVANILGLISMFNKEKTDDPRNQEVMQKLDIVSRQLDDVIREIVRNSNEIQHPSKK